MEVQVGSAGGEWGAAFLRQFPCIIQFHRTEQWNNEPR